jgi:hypothetical protein
MPLPTMNDVSPVNQLLSNLSVAYRQDMPAISDLIFPRVSVELPNGTYFTWAKADRWRSQTFKHAARRCLQARRAKQLDRHLSDGRVRHGVQAS